MKIITIGDVHGRDKWKEIVKQEADKYIFIGDYFDSWTETAYSQIDNFKEILQFKKDNFDKVILLCGNHDYHYLGYSDDRYSGYQEKWDADFQEVLREAIENGELIMTIEYDGFLFSHAGVTKTWCEFAHIDMGNLVGSINKTFMYTPQMFQFMKFKNAEIHGDNVYQSPIWVRPASLLKDGLDEYTQVVGHTTMERIVMSKKACFIDVPNEYLIINNKELCPESLSQKTAVKE